MSHLRIELVGPHEPETLPRGPLWDLLVVVDHEFVPSLSSRESTTTRALAENGGGAGPVTYYGAVCRQWGLWAHDDGGAAGMMSFIPHHSDEALGAFCPATYLSTLAVLPAYRRAGTARKMYARLIEHSAQIGDVTVATRTWSTNRGHLSLLGELGFVLTARIPDHRGPGVDTVYLARPGVPPRR